MWKHDISSKFVPSKIGILSGGPPERQGWNRSSQGLLKNKGQGMGGLISAAVIEQVGRRKSLRDIDGNALASSRQSGLQYGVAAVQAAILIDRFISNRLGPVPKSLDGCGMHVQTLDHESAILGYREIRNDCRVEMEVFLQLIQRMVAEIDRLAVLGNVVEIEKKLVWNFHFYSSAYRSLVRGHRGCLNSCMVLRYLRCNEFSGFSAESRENFERNCAMLPSKKGKRKGMSNVRPGMKIVINIVTK
jgi:hypothetical protein